MNPSLFLYRIFVTALLFVLASALLVSSGVSAQPGDEKTETAGILTQLGTGFTYQGELQDANGLVTGTCDFQIRLLDSATNGNQVGSTQTVSNVSVVDGRFSIVLNGSGEFGASAFMGDARWLEVSLRCPAGSGDFTVLTPRQELTATPYAIYANKAGTVGWDGVTSVPTDIADGDDDTLGHLVCANGEVAVWNGTGWDCTGSPAGPQGPKGDTGATGPQGPEGPEGPPGTTDWNGLANIPVDIADGDDDTTYTAGTGLLLSSNEFSVNFNGDGLASTVSRSDHTHGGQIWTGGGGLGLQIVNTSSSGPVIGLRVDTQANISATTILARDGSTTGVNFGIIGVSESISGTGVAGFADATTGSGSVGVWGQTDAPGGRGVVGYASHNTGVNAGIYGSTDSTNGWAGFFNGDVNVNGTLFKDAGAFRIDHPLDPENKYLNHSFVESPDMMNIYNGNVTLDETGIAWVQLPDWFEALNQDFRYQLTPIGAPGPNLYIAEPIANNRFKIAGGTADMTVSWQVTGIRHDPYAEAHRIVVEEEKPDEEKGTYLSASEWGQPQGKDAEFRRLQSLREQLGIPVVPPSIVNPPTLNQEGE